MRKKMMLHIDEKPTTDSVRGLFSYIENLNNLEYAIERFISNDYYGLDIDSIIDEKNAFITANPKERLDLPTKIEIRNKTGAAKKALTAFNQGSELFKAAESVTILTKPILIYYGMLNFAKGLIFSTYRYRRVYRSHGLKFEVQNKKIIIERRGEFQRLHDCVRSDLSLYLQPPSAGYTVFEIDELISFIPRITGKLGIGLKRLPDYDPGKRFGYKIGFDITNTQNRVFRLHNPWGGVGGGIGNIHELEVSYLLAFGLCSLARYHPDKWRKIAESQDVYAYHVFLEHTLTGFPTFILSELLGTYIIMEEIGKSGSTPDIKI
jgi:hypothetical protein